MSNPNVLRLALARLDGRVAAAFAVVTVLLFAPFVYDWAQPSDQTRIGDQVTSLRSDVTEAMLLIDNRDRVPPTYFAAQAEDLADGADQAAGVLQHRPVASDVADLRRQYVDLADTFAQTLQKTALAYDDTKTRRDARKTLEDLGQKLDALSSGG